MYKEICKNVQNVGSIFVNSNVKIQENKKRQYLVIAQKFTKWVQILKTEGFSLVILTVYSYGGFL